MSGHSKWANIKRKKEATDSKKSKEFSKLSRLISVAAREGGADADSNPKLRLAIEKAKYRRMPKENIDRAIQKGSGQITGQSFTEAIYEAYGPHGEAFYITALTDNPNRTVSEIRNIFSRVGGSLGGAGSTAYIFSPDPENPNFKVDVEQEQIEKLQGLVNELEDHDDIQEVYLNFDLPEVEE